MDLNVYVLLYPTHTSNKLPWMSAATSYSFWQTSKNTYKRTLVNNIFHEPILEQVAQFTKPLRCFTNQSWNKSPYFRLINVKWCPWIPLLSAIYCWMIPLLENRKLWNFYFMFLIDMKCISKLLLILLMEN